MCNTAIRFTSTCTLILVVLTISVMSLPVNAEAAKASRKQTIEEVVVTARRTEEGIQDVPIAVTAMTGAMMEDRGVVSTSDLQMSTPSLSFSSTHFGDSNVSIRGIGKLITSGDSGVSTHINEIPIESNLNAIEFYDMERVEVLRGPQGTLFGRNATGGALNFITRLPDFENINGFLDIEAGDYNNVRVKGAINIPITETFAVRLAGLKLDRDGYIDNLAYGQVADAGVGAGIDTISGINKDLDGRDISSYRITANWAISDNAELWVMYTNFHENDDRVRISNQICVTNPLPTTGCTPDGVGFETPHALSSTGGIIFGLSANAIALTDTPTKKYQRIQPGLRKMHTDFQPTYEEDEDIFAFNFSYDFDDYSFGLIGAYQERNFVSQQDYYMDTGALLFDGSINFPVSAPAGNRAGDEWRSGPCNLNAGTSGAQAGSNPNGACNRDIDGSVIFMYDQQATHKEYWTVEAKMGSHLNGPLNFVVGVNAYENEHLDDYYVLGNALDAGGSYPGFFLSGDDPKKPAQSDGWAVFGELYYEFSDDLKFTLGLRYNEDHREDFATNVIFNAFDLNGPLGGALGEATLVRNTLANFIFGAPLGEQTDLAALYGVDTSTITAAEATAPASPERIALATSIPFVPQSAETRFLSGSPTEFDFDNVSGRIGFDWRLNNESMIYAFYSRGYKPGGLNGAIPEAFQGNSSFSYDSEEIDAFEIGSKNRLLDGTMILNASLFYYDYQGLQISRVKNNASINDNISAKMWGLELESHWRPSAIPNLQINAAYSYLNTEVDGSKSIDPTNRTANNPDWVLLNNLDVGSTTGVNFIAQDPAAVLAAIPGCLAVGGVVPLPHLSYSSGIPALWSRNCLDGAGITTSDGLESDLDGNHLPNTPEHNISLGMGYTWEISAIAGALTLRWDYYWQADSFGRDFNTKGDEIDSWDQHNASLIYESSNGTWSGRLFIRNVQNEDNVTGHFLSSDTSGFYRNYFLTEPRIFGLSVRYDLGAN